MRNRGLEDRLASQISVNGVGSPGSMTLDVIYRYPGGVTEGGTPSPHAVGRIMLVLQMGTTGRSLEHIFLSIGMVTVLPSG